MIKTIYLFTNRNTLAFDEEGEQIVEIQSNISWSVDWTKESKEKEEEILAKIAKDKPVIFLSAWRKWRKEISLNEFCSLLGHGEWYWENYEKDKKEE